MARSIAKLSSIALQRKGPGLHADGNGLYLQVKRGGRSWVFRYMLDRKARYMGLGPFPQVSLADARRDAEECRRVLREGIDPINAREQRKEEVRLEAAKSVTFEYCARRYIETNKAGWRNEKHAAQWTSTLETYAFPTFGPLPVAAINTALVMKALDPIWGKKPETATRVRQRIEVVLGWATAHGYRTGDNPARWRGLLDKLLPKRSKVRAVKHHAAMPYAQMPEFFEELSKRNAISAKALAFTILTAARSGETRYAKLSEIDLAQAVWTVPAARTKSHRDHRVPLQKEAMALLRGLPGFGDDPNAFLFPNLKGRALSDTALRKYLQEDLGYPALTVHGFRSTFRDWAAEQTHFPREVAEAALAHVVGDKTEAAYQRGDMLLRRRKLMEAWARYCVSGAAARGKVVSIRNAR